MFSSHLRRFPPSALGHPTIKKMYHRLISESMSLTRCTDEELDLVSGHCTAAVSGPQKRVDQIQRINFPVHHVYVVTKVSLYLGIP